MSDLVIYQVITHDGPRRRDVIQGPHPWSVIGSAVRSRDAEVAGGTFDAYHRHYWEEAEAYWDHAGPQLEWAGYALHVRLVRHPEVERVLTDVELRLRLAGSDPDECWVSTVSGQRFLSEPLINGTVYRTVARSTERRVDRLPDRLRTVQVGWVRRSRLTMNSATQLEERGWEDQACLVARRRTRTGAPWRRGGGEVVRWIPEARRWALVTDERTMRYAVV